MKKEWHGLIVSMNVVFILAVAAPALVAHSGASLQAPLTASPFSAIDGTIDAASGPERSGAPAVCSAMKLYALRTAASLYLAVDVPELTADPDDVLLLFFDRNHSGGTTPDAADRAIRLVGFPAGTNQTPTTAEIYSGNGTDWVTPAAFATVKSSRTGAGPGARLVVELTVPITTAPLGVAAFYASKDDQDCNNDGLLDNAFTWPPTLPTPGGDALGGVKDPSQWGDLGRRAPLVTFVAPTCCSSADITFVPNIQPFTPGTNVDITANVHNLDTTFDAKNVDVQIRVHKFGTGGGVIFTSSPDPVIGLIGHSASATTSAVQWPAVPAGTHGCIQAEIQPPVEGGARSLDDYSLAGSNTLAQYNIDVACVPKGMMKRLEFITFNPNKGKAATIALVKQQRVPRGLEGLTFDLVQPDRPLSPLEELNVALVVTAPADAPTTNLPRQTVHVPPTAGRTDAVAVQAKPGDRLHVSATGDVDIDGGGPVASTGPDGSDVSQALRGQFLLPGESAARVGGALIGSFDGFATSFLVGSEATVTVPPRSEGLRLAINDIVEKQADNTGKGFDVEAWVMPAAAQPIPAGAAAAAAPPAEPPFPEVRIVATSVEKVTIADKVYTIVRELGAVTYQLLVTEPGAQVPPPPKYWIWLLLLILLVVVALFALKKRKTAS